MTWLYGPLYTTDDWTPLPKRAFDSEAFSMYDRYDLFPSSGTKPILKHPSISELLTRNWPSPLFGSTVSGVGDLIEVDLHQTRNGNIDRGMTREHRLRMIADVATPTVGADAGSLVATTENESSLSGMSNVQLSGHEEDLTVKAEENGKKRLVRFDPACVHYRADETTDLFGRDSEDDEEGTGITSTATKMRTTYSDSSDEEGMNARRMATKIEMRYSYASDEEQSQQRGRRLRRQEPQVCRRRRRRPDNIIHDRRQQAGGQQKGYDIK